VLISKTPGFSNKRATTLKNGYGIAVARLAPAMENNTELLRCLTLQETAELLHLSTRTLLRLLQRKDLPAFKVGHQWRIHENALAKWLEELHEL